MKINARVLGWTDKCCGCGKNIPGTEKVYMISNLLGVSGSIHLCEECISQITGDQGIFLKNIDLTGIDADTQQKKIFEELSELEEAIRDYIKIDDKKCQKELTEHVAEEYFDLCQSALGLIQIVTGITAEEVMREYSKHLKKLESRPREKKCSECVYYREESKRYIGDKKDTVKMYCDSLNKLIRNETIAKKCKRYKEQEE